MYVKKLTLHALFTLVNTKIVNTRLYVVEIISHIQKNSRKQNKLKKSIRLLLSLYYAFVRFRESAELAIKIFFNYHTIRSFQRKTLTEHSLLADLEYHLIASL